MKDSKRISLEYSIDASHKGAPYFVNGSYCNHGDFCEIAVKAAYGLDAKKNACGRYDLTDDVPEYNASVKSSTATIANVKLGETLEASCEVYFNNVHSSEFWYVHDEHETLSIFKMNAATFKRFLLRFAKLNERGYIRLGKTSSMMLAWLNTNCR